LIHSCFYEGGGPTIVLAAGAGQDSRTWGPLLGELAAISSVVTFDRPGLGQTPNAEGPRTPTAIALEVRDLLTSLGVSGTTLLVGHSMGGIHLLRYADLFPDSVAGVVLLDTPPPDFELERMALLTAQESEARRRVLAVGRSSSPEVVGRERDGAAGEPWVFEEFPKDSPLLVVVGDSQDFGESGIQEAHQRLWHRLSRQWLELSSRSELIVAKGSGHMVHWDRPRLVLDLVYRLVEASRAGGTGRGSG
jgi:pimeloyl-ACP methyl ester carboxylesterase